MKSVKCPGCGLVAFAGVPTCKRCGASFEGAPASQVQSDAIDTIDTALLESIKAKKSIILMVGFLGSLVLGLVAYFLTEDTLTMVILFGGIIAVGFIWTWVITTKVETRMLAGRNIPNPAITPAQRASALTSSLVTAAIVLHTDYGWFLAPFVIVVFNGALYLYERQVRAKLGNKN